MNHKIRKVEEQNRGMKITTLARKYHTPLYLYDLAIIKENTQRLKNAFSPIPEAKFQYALKANYNPKILNHIIHMGLGVDAVSVHEVKLAINCGTKVSDILFTVNNISESEMEEAHGLGVLFNIGSNSELEKFGEKFPGSSVCIRINPNIGAASHKSNITGGPESKFGIPLYQLEKARAIAKKCKLKVVGLHQHIGSGWLNTNEPLRASKILFQEALIFRNLEFVNLGGGFGIPYKPSEKPLNIEELAREISKQYEKFCLQYGARPQIIFEPGRYIVAEAGKLITTVTNVKQVKGKTFIGTDTGMHQLPRVALYGAYHAISNISNPDGFPEKYDICGNVCECADFFARNRKVPKIRQGDILSIENAGAYCMSMASNYQFRPLPAEVLVDGNRAHLIRKRQSFGDMLNLLKY